MSGVYVLSADYGKQSKLLSSKPRDPSLSFSTLQLLYDLLSWEVKIKS